jgi:hypothetical protein
MAYITGELNGSGPFYVGMDVWYSGAQDWGANTSRFDWTVYIGCWNNGWGTWSGSTQYWSCSIGGVGYSGTFTLDFRPSTSSARRYAIASGSTWHGHDANGFRGGFPSSAYINTDHSSVGDGGSGDAWVDAPRIPQLPKAPSMNSISNILPTSAGVNYSRGDDMGAGIDYDNIQYSRNNAFTDVIWQDTPPNGNPSGYSGNAPLVPGTQYWVRGASHNTRGWSPWSNVLNFRTLSGVYRWGGAAWIGEEARVWDGDSWEIPDFMVRDGANTQWERAL